MMRTVEWCGWTMAGLAVACSTAASAQEADAGKQVEAKDPELTEIIVTAQRREQSASRVPISITVVGGEELADRGVSTLQDVTLSIPNFQIAQTGLSTQSFIRGIGSGSDPAFELSVAQYIDGVSFGRAQLTRTPLFDVGRVEVLRGPQSILFGKNSTAGAVSIISNQPTKDLSAGLTTTYTPTFGQVETTAYASGPVSDTIGARFAIRHVDEGGYVHNITRNQRQPQREEIAARAILNFDGGTGFRLALKGEYSKFDVDGRDIEVIHDVATRTIPAGPSAGQPLTFAAGLGLRGLPGVLTNTSLDGRREADIADFDDTRLVNLTLTAEVDIGGSTITAVTGYLDYGRKAEFDLDFTSANILGGGLREKYEQVSQELRIATPADAALSFVGGLYYEHNVLDYVDITGFGPNLAQLGFGVIANVGVRRDFKQRSDSYSGFGQLTLRIGDSLRLIGGLRVSRDEKDATRLLSARTGQFDYDGPLTLSPAVIGTLQAGLGFSLNNIGGAGHNIAGARARTQYVPSATIEFDVSPETLLFASYKEGFKGGGFNARANNNRSFEFDDETVNAWEAGLRTRFAGNRGSFGLTAYRAEYSNLQLTQFDGTVGFNVGNAGGTRTQGVETDVRFAIARGVTVSAAASYLDFKYLDFRRGNCAFVETPSGDIVNGVPLCNYTGRRGRFAHEWNLSGSLSVDRPVSSAINIRGSLEASYKSSHDVHDNLDPLGRVEGYTILDARLGFGGENWDLTVIGRNLLDEVFPTYAANVPFASSLGANTQYATRSRGRSVAVQIALRY